MLGPGEDEGIPSLVLNGTPIDKLGHQQPTTNLPQPPTVMFPPQTSRRSLLIPGQLVNEFARRILSGNPPQLDLANFGDSELAPWWWCIVATPDRDMQLASRKFDLLIHHHFQALRNRMSRSLERVLATPPRTARAPTFRSTASPTRDHNLQVAMVVGHHESINKHPKPLSRSRMTSKAAYQLSLASGASSPVFHRSEP